MIELTTEQALSIRRNGAFPPLLFDPSTQETFVLIKKVDYDRMIRRC